MQFRREQAAGAVGQLDGQRPPEHPGCDQVTGDDGESEPLPGRAVHPVAEPLVADAEGEPAEQRRAVPGIVVELLGKLDGPVDRLDDDPPVLGAAQRLSLDHLAGEPVADQARAEFLRRLPGADPEFHDFAGPHA